MMYLWNHPWNENHKKWRISTWAQNMTPNLSNYQGLYPWKKKISTFNCLKSLKIYLHEGTEILRLMTLPFFNTKFLWRKICSLSWRSIDKLNPCCTLWYKLCDAKSSSRSDIQSGLKIWCLSKRKMAR
jgi:hypothetical protein